MAFSHILIIQFSFLIFPGKIKYVFLSRVNTKLYLNILWGRNFPDILLPRGSAPALESIQLYAEIHGYQDEHKAGCGCTDNVARHRNARCISCGKQQWLLTPSCIYVCIM